MIEVQGKLISTEILENKFVCHLEACKGACCVEGEEGAPLEKAEVEAIKRNFDKIWPYLDDEGKTCMAEMLYTTIETVRLVTPLKADGACIYSRRNNQGVLYCAIEKSYQNGDSDFLKPISCHLYPIRVSINKSEDWEALNYSDWDICNAACTLGKKLNIPVFVFLKQALIRKYGSEFYDELESVAKNWINRNEKD